MKLYILLTYNMLQYNKSSRPDFAYRSIGSCNAEAGFFFSIDLTITRVASGKARQIKVNDLVNQIFTRSFILVVQKVIQTI